MKTGALLQILSFEIGLGCNLCAIHPQCPNSLGRHRYAALAQDQHLTDASILHVVDVCVHEHDFRGWINFSFYNEPMLDVVRLQVLADQIKRRVPNRLMLITNGMFLTEDPRALSLFDWVGVTDYGGAQHPDPQRLQALRDLLGEGVWEPDPRGVFVTKARLDRRMRGLGPDRSDRPCVYPFKDLAIDYFGNGHVCCYDWRGLAHVGNFLTEEVTTCLHRWEQIVRAIAGPVMLPYAPESCRRCQYRGFQRLERLDQGARLRAQAWLEALRSDR